MIAFPSVVVVMVFVVYGIYEFTTPGGFSNWSEWTPCSLSCGEGQRVRTRKCDNPSPSILGLDCPGQHIEKEKCMLVPCPVNGGYSQWTAYGKCDKTCGGGKKTRSRKCDNPSAKHGGKTCARLGNSEETLTCNVNPCPINGGYSDWGAYSECEMEGEKHCGKGKKVRTRTCNKPVPQHGGKKCEGPEHESADCEIPCPTSTILTTISTNVTTNVTTTTTTTQPKKVQ